MMGRKTLAEVRAELEAALGAGPPGDGEVAMSLRRFLARAFTGKRVAPNQALQPTGAANSVPPDVQPLPAAPAAEL